MATKKAAKKRSPSNGSRPRLDFRFVDSNHKKLVTQAAKKDGQSVNAWMVQVTLKAAREALGRG